MVDFSHIGGRQIKKINNKTEKEKQKNNKHIHFIKKREKGACTCTYTYLKQNKTKQVNNRKLTTYTYKRWPVTQNLSRL